MCKRDQACRKQVPVSGCQEGVAIIMLEKRKKTRSRKKWMLLLIMCILFYLILGALVPFMFQKKVGDEWKKAFHNMDFYGTEEPSVDRAGIVETNEDALEVRLRMFEEAEEQIILSTFDIRPGGSCTDIFASLLEAAQRGVKVRIFVDGLYGGIHMKQDPMFYAVGSHPNVEIRFYNIPNLLAPWTINGRMHDKYILVDDKLLLLGGRNTFDYFIGNYTDQNISYDREVLIYNTAWGTSRSQESVLAQAEDYFSSIWKLDCSKTVYEKVKNKKKTQKAEEELRRHYEANKQARPEQYAKNTDYKAITVPIRKATFLANPTHIYAKEPYVWYGLTELMKAAADRVYIQTPYAAFSKDMYKDLKEIADLVPDVKLQINSVAVGDNFMASSDYIFNKKKIWKTGAEVFEFQGDYSSHGKSGLIDQDLSFVGSYNLDMRSTYVDTETVLVIHGEEFNQLLEGYVMDMHQKSLKRNLDGRYESKDGVEEVKLPNGKKILFSFTSVLFQLFRYLI